MKITMLASAVIEALVGLGLIFMPETLAQLLFGQSILAPLTIVIARLAGVALISLAVASARYPLAGLVLYNAGATVVLGLAGLAGGLTGVLLWPAVVFHVVMTVLLARDLRKAG
jgi:hypothetical protein